MFDITGLSLKISLEGAIGISAWENSMNHHLCSIYLKLAVGCGRVKLLPKILFRRT